MSIISEKIKKARQSKVEAGGFIFTITRPTDMDMNDNRELKIKTTQKHILTKYVVGWENVKEMDLFPGGTGEMVPFDTDTYVEFISDHPELWSTIATAIVQAYQDHEARLVESIKN